MNKEFNFMVKKKVEKAIKKKKMRKRSEQLRTCEEMSACYSKQKSITSSSNKEGEI